LVDGFAVDIETIAAHIEVAPTIYTNGDSIALGAFEDESSGVIPAHSYTNLYALNHDIDYRNEAVSAETISEIASRVDTDLQKVANGSTYMYTIKYPLHFLSGGTNDFRVSTSDNSATLFFVNVVPMVDAVIRAGGHVVWTTVPPSPILDNATYARDEWAVNYNNLFKTQYGDNALVTIIDSDELLNDDDFSSDGLHPTINGHRKLANNIIKNVPLPNYSEKFENLINVGNMYTADLNGPRISEQRGINWALQRTITADDYIDGNNFDVTIFLDADDNAVTATLRATPDPGEIHYFKSVNADNTCTIHGNGRNIEGAATDTLALDKGIMIQYDGAEWRILSEI